MSLHQYCETQAMPEPPGNLSEEISFEICNSNKPIHATAVLTEECSWMSCLICEQPQVSLRLAGMPAGSSHK